MTEKTPDMEEPPRCYWKEIVGTAMWIALILFLLMSDRIPGCSPPQSSDQGSAAEEKGFPDQAG